MMTCLIKFYVLSVIITTAYSNSLKLARENHSSLLSTNEQLRSLATLTDVNYLNKVLDNILIPRVVGTANHEKVAKYITNELKRSKWNVEIDEFTARAPIFGDLQFKNIIATFNPEASRFLVLACHYDSKYFQNVEFVGAIDSAVPCAMMLELAKTLTPDLKKKNNPVVGLKFMFFDGEEAFEEWGPNDSIYGAKHLAKKLHSNRSVLNGETVTELDRIDILVLLDLIGAKDPNFMNFFPSTEHWFLRLAQIEKDLHEMQLLVNHRRKYFRKSRPYGRIEDDHVPFLKRNVPVLHLITAPFPAEWHTVKDNRDLVDMDTVVNINLILKTFISEYLHLSDSNLSARITSPENSSTVEEPEIYCLVGDIVLLEPILYY